MVGSPQVVETMSRTFGPVRVASWGHKFKKGVRGFAVSWNGRGLLLSFEVHYERRG